MRNVSGCAMLSDRTVYIKTSDHHITDKIFHFQVLNTSTSITLTPDDLLTLGYKRTEDGKLIKWADYWSLIVEVVETSTQDYLIHVSVSP